MLVIWRASLPVFSLWNGFEAASVTQQNSAALLR
jgi:hypothetical protein